MGRRPLERSRRALRLAVRIGKGAGERARGAEAARGRRGGQGQGRVTGEARSRKSRRTAPRPAGHRRPAVAGKQGRPPPDRCCATLGKPFPAAPGGKAARRPEQRHLGTIDLIFKNPLVVSSCPAALGERRAFRPGAAGTRSRPRGGAALRRAPFPAGLVGGERKGVATPAFSAPRHPLAPTAAGGAAFPPGNGDGRRPLRVRGSHRVACLPHAPPR